MKRIAFIIALAGFVSQEWGARADIILHEPNVYYSSILIGDGRNDDTSRLYLLTKHNPEGDSYYTIRELSFSRGEWHIAQVCSLPYIKGIALTKGRNDGVYRLYVTSDSSLIEYTFSEGTWSEVEIVKYPYLTSILATKAHNDDTLRIYCEYWEELIELTFSQDEWIAREIPNVYGHLKAAGTGRNDDTIRLYTDFEELTYSDGLWKIEHPEEICPIHFIGDGRGDSIIRIYGYGVTYPDDISEIIESTYSNGVWHIEYVDRVPAKERYMEDGIAGIAREDGKSRLYFIGVKQKRQ